MADQKVSDLPSLNGADVDAADLLYIIDSSAGSAGSKKITVGQYQLAPVSGGTANGVLYLNASKVATAGSDLVFDGSNLGIGTSSPVEKLAVNQGNFYAIRTGGAKLRLADQNNEVSVESSPTGVVSNMVFKTAATTQMTLDSSGNLGLGVTPSAWTGSGGKNIEVGATGNALFGSTSLTAYTSNANFDSSWKYSRTGFASRYEQQDSNHRWFTAPSGTAGNAISFTQAMTLDASGDLTVGAVDDGGRLNISGASGFAGTGLSLYETSSGNGRRLRIYQDTTGVIYNATFSTADNAHIWQIGNDERARITSAGDLLVGQTSGGVKNSNSFGLDVSGGGYLTISHINGSASGTRYEYYGYNGAEIGSVTQNGTTGVLFNTTSDRRLKDNITPAPSASDVIDAIEIVSHDWKSAPDEHVTYGVIAQDLALVAPQAVLQGDDGDEIEKTWGVDYSKLVPMLIKEIQTLRARVAALESA